MLCHIRWTSTQGPNPRATPVRSDREGKWIATSALGLRIPGGHCSIVLSIPACHGGDRGSIPGNGESCLAIAMSYPVGFYPSSQSAGYSVRSELEGNWIETSALGLPIPGGRCCIVVSIPACHAGDPGSIPGNGASCLAIVMSHPVDFYPGSQSACYSALTERESG